MRLAFPICLILLTLALPLQSRAQEPSAPAAAAARSDAAAIGQVIDLLRDDARRQALLSELETLRASVEAGQPAPAAAAEDASSAEPADEAGTAADEPPTEIVTQDGVIGALASTFADSVGDVSSATFGVPLDEKFDRAAAEIDQRVAARFGGERTLGFLLWALPGVLLVVGFYILVSRHPFVRRRRRLDGRPTERGIALLRLVGPRLFFGLLPVILTAALASTYAALMAPTWREGQLFVGLLSPFVAAILARRTVFWLLLFLGPTRGWRIVGYASRRLLPWVGTLAGLAAVANLLREFSVRVLVGTNFADVMALVMDLSLAGITLWFVLAHRLTIRTLLVRGRRGNDADDSRASGALAQAFGIVADWWHVIAFAFIAANVLARLLGLGGGSFVWESILSIAYLLGAFALLAVLNYTFSRAAQRGARRKVSMRRAVIERYIDIAHVLVQIAVAALALLWILDTWGFPLSSWLATSDGRRLMRPLASLVIVPALIYALWTTIDTVITSALEPQDAAGRTRERSARVRTLLPLVRNLVFVVLIVVTVIAVLANIGIDVVPLLAGAGVIGLAFSLGAQQLVKDVIAGFFIIFEDTIAIGDRVTAGDKSGTVEGITIRTMRLRESSGAVHSIPFGQITTLRNDSRGFGVFPISIGVASECSVDDAIQALRDAGQSLWKEPETRRRMVGPPSILGLGAIGADSFTLQGEIRCHPLQQNEVGREFLRRLKQLFEERELKFA